MGPISKSTEMILKFYSLLLHGEMREITTMFVGGPLLNEPTKGMIQGDREFEHFLGNYRQWLLRRNPRVEHIDSTDGESRTIVECVLHSEYKKLNIQLPLAIVGDMDGDKIIQVRIYHSLWPLFHYHTVRAPIFSMAESVSLPPLIDDYMKCLKAGDTENILTLFEDDGYVREPGGDAFKHAGHDGLKKFYQTALAQGGIPLTHCTCTCDGIKCAVELTIDRWGKADLPPQAGIAVFEKGSSGKLGAIRIYDDVEPPFAKI